MAITGTGGNVKVGAAPSVVGDVEQWKLDIDTDTLETTNFSSNGWKEYIAGLKEWSGSFDAQWDVANDTNGQEVIQNNQFSGTSMTLEFDVDGTHHYSGTALIKKASIDTQVKGVVKISYTYQGSGALSYA